MAREAHIDPVLQNQLARAAGLQKSVAATITVRGPSDSLMSAEETNDVVKKLLERIQRRTRTKPHDVNIFSNLQSFAVDAPPDFVEELLRQPEVDSAMASEQEESMFIRPVEQEEVSVDEVEGRAKRPAAKRRRGR